MKPIRPGIMWAVASISVGISAILIAATNQPAGEFVSRYQTLLTALFAFGIACIAYDASTASARHARQKDRTERNQTRAKHFINMFAEIDGMAGARLTICNTLSNWPLEPSSAQCKAMNAFADPYQLHSITAAFQNVGIFDPRMRHNITDCYRQLKSVHVGLKNVNESFIDADVTARKVVAKSLVVSVALLERSLSKLLSALNLEVKKVGITMDTSFESRSAQCDAARQNLENKISTHYVTAPSS